MTLVRFKNKPDAKNFNNFMNGFLNDLPSIFSDDYYNSNINQFVPVNITETDQAYVIELVAPGLEKEDFKINLDNNLLTVSAEKKDEIKNENDKQIRKEYKFQSFKRSFTIDENIATENIVAKYINGVLTLNLPRKTEVKTSAKEISIQ